MDLTVAIATWNRADLLRQTLEGLERMAVPDGVNWHLLVCDNASTDHTRQTVESFADRLPVRYLHEPTQGKSYALNHLLAEARTLGQWVLFTDDDVLVEPDWMQQYVTAMRRYPDAACFGGPMLPWVQKPLRGRASFLTREYPGVYALLNVEKDTPIEDPEHLAYGANMALRLDAVPEQGFDVNLGPKAGGRVDGEDVGMIRAILDAGHTGWLLAGAKVRHYVHPSRLTLRYFWKWQMFIGRAAAHNRGGPQPGKFGVAWWAWKEFARRLSVAALRWRPWCTRAYYDAMIHAAWYLGYLLHREDGRTNQPTA